MKGIGLQSVFVDHHDQRTDHKGGATMIQSDTHVQASFWCGHSANTDKYLPDTSDNKIFCQCSAHVDMNGLDHTF